MTTLILILIVLAIAYYAINFETSNPFTVIKYASKDIGIAAGATPRILKTAKDSATTLAKESKVEMLKSGDAATVSFKEGRKIGQNWAKETLSEYNAELAERKAKAVAELAELTK